MTELQKDRKMAGLACKALKTYYGFGPTKNQIVLLEGTTRYDEIEMVLFRIAGQTHREYRVTLTQYGKHDIIVDDTPYDLKIYGGY